MKRSEFLEKAGFTCIANHETKELHRVANLCRRCHIERIKHGGYCTALWGFVLRKLGGYDGCFYCNGKYHHK